MTLRRAQEGKAVHYTGYIKLSFSPAYTFNPSLYSTVSSIKLQYLLMRWLMGWVGRGLGHCRLGRGDAGSGTTCLNTLYKEVHDKTDDDWIHDRVAPGKYFEALIVTTTLFVGTFVLAPI
jgi:hypothetical protein